MSPTISIIIPCYNQGHYILDAIDSIQKYPYNSIYEIIIVNDGSSEDETKTTLRSLEEKGYQVLNQENKGLETARNNGIMASKGKYILPLDADNKIRPGYLEKGIHILDNNPAVGIVYGDSLYFEDVNKVFKAGKFSLRKLLVENYIDACVVLRRETWKEVGGYDPKTSPLSDWDFNLSAAGLGWNFHYIPEIMFDYRVRNDSMVRKMENRDQLINYLAKKHGTLYRDEFRKNLTIKSRIKGVFKDLWQKILGNPQY